MAGLNSEVETSKALIWPDTTPHESMACSSHRLLPDYANAEVDLDSTIHAICVNRLFRPRQKGRAFARHDLTASLHTRVAPCD